jgi:hypothetical protein
MNYVAGFILESNWDSSIVHGINTLHQFSSGFTGDYVNPLEKSSPFEKWIALTLNEIVKADVAKGWMHPGETVQIIYPSFSIYSNIVSFYNTISFDPFQHPLALEKDKTDLVTLDPNNIVSSGDIVPPPANPFNAGIFYSYATYPFLIFHKEISLIRIEAIHSIQIFLIGNIQLAWIVRAMRILMQDIYISFDLTTKTTPC